MTGPGGPPGAGAAACGLVVDQVLGPDRAQRRPLQRRKRPGRGERASGVRWDLLRPGTVTNPDGGDPRTG
jgi:hypothetical protein